MKRDLITRRIAIAVLFAFSTLMLVAVAPLVYGLRSYDPTPGLALSASQADTLVINNPVRLSTNPDIVLVSGTVIAATTPQGAPPRGLTLVSPVIDVRIGSETPSASRLAAAMVSVLKPLVQRFGLRDHDNVSIQRGVIGISGKHSKSIALTDVVASIAVKHPGEFSASGQFIYAGQGVTFEISTSLRIANNAAAESATDAPSASDKKPVVPASAKTLSPMRFKMSSELFSASFDGGIEQEPPQGGGAAPGISGYTELKTAHFGKFADWLGFGWPAGGSAAAVQISGPARWTIDELAFGRSQILLDNHVAVGAASLRLHDGRPVIDGTAAFSTLDVAPYLEQDKANGLFAFSPSLFRRGNTEPSVLEKLATTFPFMSAIDIDLRLSADRLHWRGQSIGQGALSVSSRNGAYSADVPELVLGPHRASVQVSSDGKGTTPLVTLRGQVRSTNIEQLGGRFLPANTLTGQLTSQFELRGRGDTFAAVLVTADGHGHIEIRNGRLGTDLSALRKLTAAAPPGTLWSGWDRTSGVTPFSDLTAKLRMSRGNVEMDQVQIHNRALLASISGRFNAAKSGDTLGDVDLRIFLGAPTEPETTPRKSPPQAPRAVAPAIGDVVYLRGPVRNPAFSTPDVDPLP